MDGKVFLAASFFEAASRDPVAAGGGDFDFGRAEDLGAAWTMGSLARRRGSSTLVFALVLAGCNFSGGCFDAEAEHEE